jgi:hypothetical protein
MERLESENKELWKQIGKLHNVNDELTQRIHILAEKDLKSAKELDDVETLQRIQAQAIVDLRKVRKH